MVCDWGYSVSPILGIIASQNYPRVTNSYESIATVTVGAGGSSSISFTSIPSDYTHLQIRGIGRNNQTSRALLMRFNSDTGANYVRHLLIGDGSSATADATTSTTSMFAGTISRNTYSSAIFGSTIIDILDYKNTNKNKTMRFLAGVDANTVEGIVIFGSGLWMNTNAITSITILPDTSGTFPQYSQFALYGIKGS